MMIATGFRTHTDPDNTTVEATLTEDSWYHVPDEVRTIPSASFNEGSGHKPAFIGRRVSKIDFMRVLGSLGRILIRAKYHTDQLEGS